MSASRRSWRVRLTIFGRCVAAGATIALSVPPFGWWPLAFVGIAQWDRLLADADWARRFRRSWLVAACWLFPTMLWMWDLTAPGYLIACSAYSAYFGTVMAVVPPRSSARWIALPGAIVLGELWRWNWPFGGVPLATLAISQAAAPLAQTARLGNAIFVSGLVAVGGVALSAAWERRFRVAGAIAAAIVAVYLLSVVVPRGHDTEPLRVAVVQGGGPQRTRAATTDPRVVFERHLAASHLIERPVDLVVWPENVVSVDGSLPGTYEDRQLSALARELGAPLIVGVTEGYDAEHFLNAAVVYLPDGSMGERFDKVKRVPFGEWVPLRSLIEKVAGDSGIPSRDAIPGTTPAVLDTPAGVMGVVISWEVFFTERAADAIGNGGEVLLNPTNGSSYWLTQVQSQQVASSRLRAIETGRWEVQAAPTGFSTIVDPVGRVIDCTKINDQGTTSGWCRSGVSEQIVLQAVIQRRQGRTLALTIGQWPTLVLAILAVAGGWIIQRRQSPGSP